MSTGMSRLSRHFSGSLISHPGVDPNLHPYLVLGRNIGVIPPESEVPHFPSLIEAWVQETPRRRPPVLAVSADAATGETRSQTSPARAVRDDDPACSGRRRGASSAPSASSGTPPGSRTTPPRTPGRATAAVPV